MAHGTEGYGTDMTETKDDKVCTADGCGHYATVRWGSKGWCEFHAELFERGTAFQKASPIVTRFAAYPPVSQMRSWLVICERSVFESECARAIDAVTKLGRLLEIPESVLRRREIVLWQGERVPEPGRVYAQRVQNYLIRFIVDRACEKVGLPAVGKTVKAAKPEVSA